MARGDAINTIIGAGLNPLTSRAKKEANNYQYITDKCELFDLWRGDYRVKDRLEKLDINYDLFNGFLDVDLYKDAACMSLFGEEVNFEHETIIHYPLISQIANAMWGEMINRPFAPSAVDRGTKRHTLRVKKWNELISRYLNETVIAPIQQQELQKYLKENGVEDMYSLNAEQQMQMQSDLRQRMMLATPEDIMEFMKNSYQTPTERQAQQFLDYLISKNDIRYKQNEGFKHAIITGEECYYVGERNGEPVFDLVNPKGLDWGASQNTEWIQDATWVKYEQWFTWEEATQRHAEALNRTDYKFLERFLEPLGGVSHRKFNDARHNLAEQRVMFELTYHQDDYVKYGKVDVKTKEGQNKMASIYNDVARKYGTTLKKAGGFASFAVRETHFAFRDKRKLYRVTKPDGKGGLNKFWFDEHYEKQPEDVKVLEVWVDEVWEATKLGTVDPIYVNVRPLKNQYKSVENPYGVELPYYGKRYNAHMNNGRNYSIVDAGKPFQMEFDIEMANLKKDMATNYGSVFMIMQDMKPDNISTNDWLNAMRNFHLLFVNPKKHGLSSIDPQLMRSINLSKSADIATRVQLLETYRSNLVNSMFFNPARVGAIGQYANATNVQSNNIASYNQTEGYFETHRKIVEKALNAHINCAKFLYKGKDFKTSYILDDITKADLELTPDFWYSELGVELSNSTQDIQQVEMLKQQMLAFAQNGMSFDSIMELSLARTKSDVIDLMRRESARMEQMRAENIQMQQQQFQQQLDQAAAMKQADIQARITELKETLASQEKRQYMDSLKFQRQADVDMNGQADAIQKALIELATKEKIAGQEAEHKEKQLELDAEIERKKLELEELELQLKYGRKSTET